MLRGLLLFQLRSRLHHFLLFRLLFYFFLLLLDFLGGAGDIYIHIQRLTFLNEQILECFKLSSPLVEPHFT